MARKLQKLINYHTSGTGMPASGDVALGEIVVRHNNEKPELLIEKTNGTFATFIDSGAVENAIAVAQTTVEGQVSSLSGSVDTKFSNYYTKAEVNNNVATAKSEAVSSAKGYTDGKITELDSALTADITALDGRIDKLESLTATTNSAIQEIKVSGITGVDVVANGTTRTLDFTDMVIDCGDF